MADLIVGGGRGFASQFAGARRELGHEVYCLSSKDQDAVDWHSINSADLYRRLRDLPRLDFVWFNQNASALSQASFPVGSMGVLDIWKQTKHWQQSYYVSCQVTFEIMHLLGDRLDQHTRVCWMLSSMIVDHQDPQHADYVGNKFQNLMLMKNFAASHPAACFGLDPGDIRGTDFTTQVNGLHRLLHKSPQELNGRVWCLDGKVSRITEILG